MNWNDDPTRRHRSGPRAPGRTARTDGGTPVGSTDGPGPPRFTSVGESVELAPRDPNPEATYEWTLHDAPADSDAGVGDGPVVHLSPDAPGVYALELEAPDGTHRQRVRAFPDERREARIAVDADDLPVPDADVDRLSVIGPFNDYRLCTDRPERVGDQWVYDRRLPPGDHWYSLAVDDDLETGYDGTVEVPGPGQPRVHLEAERTDDAIVVEASAEAPPDGEAPVDVEFYVDDRDDLSRETVTVSDRRLSVPLSALDDRVRIHAVPVAERYGVADQVALAPGEDDGTVDVRRPNDAPEWAQSPTVYEIFVRSFAGDTLETTFREIERRVPYLRSLGVDALWLTPVLASPTTHGYHITDYFDTAADLGPRSAFESLVGTLQDAGIRVVFDLVINHTSRDHPAFQMHAAGVDAYADHYRRMPAEYDAADVDWAELPAGEAPEYHFNWERIPNLNYDSLAVRRWMLDVVDEWTPLVDAFRVDVAWGVPHGFWKEVADRVPAEFLLLDETVPHDPFFHEGEFGAHYDTELYGTLRSVGSGEAPADAVLEALETVRRRGFPEPSVHLRYVENHDEDRYLAECGEAALRAAAAATFTLPGAPMIYYGQERGATDYRGPMPWHDGDTDLTEFHRSLTRLRDDHPALRSGAVERLDRTVTAGDPDAITVYARETGEERLLVLLHFGEGTATVDPGESHGGTDLRTGRAVGEGAVDVADCVVLRGEG